MARCTICAVQHRRLPVWTGGDYEAVRHYRLHEYPLALWWLPTLSPAYRNTAAFPENAIGPKTKVGDSNDQVLAMGLDMLQKAPSFADKPAEPQHQGAKDPREVELGPGKNAYGRSDDFLLKFGGTEGAALW